MITYDFSPLFRSTVGFDRMMRLVEDALRPDTSGPGYPPYNIEKTDENKYRISMAVAGFGEDELSVEVRENTLHVSGDKKEQGRETSYLYRGIASRSFKHQIRLADHVRVVGAGLENGLLTVDLVRELPEAMKPRRIAITSSGPAKPSGKRQIATEEAKQVA
jgi:molecular chaperone IbpA